MQLIPLILAAGSLSLVSGTPLPPGTPLPSSSNHTAHHHQHQHTHSLRHAHLHHNKQRSYHIFGGDGKVSEGWPSLKEWLPFEHLFSDSLSTLKESCANLGASPNNSDEEINSIKEAINEVAEESKLEASFIFALMMQESNGCVRVKTTSYSVSNPGLMQSHAGKASCQGQSPCPKSTIKEMIHEGVEGTGSGGGLKQCMSQAPGDGAVKYYEAARIYNSGHLDPSGNLGKGSATHCYCSDIANRLLGWTSGASKCNQGIISSLTNSPGGGVLNLFGNNGGGDSSSSSSSSSSTQTTEQATQAPTPSTTEEPSIALPTLSLPTLPSLPSLNFLAATHTTFATSATQATEASTPTSEPAAQTSQPAAPAETGGSSVPGGPTIISTCQQKYTLESGDSCDSLEKKFGIHIAQIVGWNQGVDSQCSNLHPGTQYCVKAPA